MIEFLQNFSDSSKNNSLSQVALEGLEDKYKINLSRDCKLLKNKKFMGTLPEHNVRTKSKPQIQEVRKLMEELKVKDGTKQMPEFQKIQEVVGEWVIGWQRPNCNRQTDSDLPMGVILMEHQHKVSSNLTYPAPFLPPFRLQTRKSLQPKSLNLSSLKILPMKVPSFSSLKSNFRASSRPKAFNSTLTRTLCS